MNATAERPFAFGSDRRDPEDRGGPEVLMVLTDVEPPIPTSAVGTAWQDVFNGQLVGVLDNWFNDGTCSRKNRRAHEKLKLVMRSSVDANDEPAAPTERMEA